MTVEERARELFFSMDKVLDVKYRKTIIAAFEQALRDQIEECAKIADKYKQSEKAEREKAKALITAMNYAIESGEPDLAFSMLERVIAVAEEAKAKEEREACVKLAEIIRARELDRQTSDPRSWPYHLIAEEIRDRIQMRPATSNSDWSELSEIRARSEG